MLTHSLSHHFDGASLARSIVPIAANALSDLETSVELNNVWPYFARSLLTTPRTFESSMVHSLSLYIHIAKMTDASFSPTSIFAVAHNSVQMMSAPNGRSQGVWRCPVRC